MIKKKISQKLLITGLLCLIYSCKVFAFEADKTELDYKISPVFQKDSVVLQIELSFTGDKSGKTVLVLPERFASQTDLYKGIKNLRVLNRNAVLKETDKEFVKIIEHKSGQKLRISYELRQFREDAARAGRGGGNSPLIQKNYIHFIGAGGWIHPESEREFRIDLNWANFPQTWKFANSFGAGQRKQSFSATAERFSSAIFVAGDYRINKNLIGEKPVYTAVRGDWSFTDGEFAGLVAKIVEIEREFWNEFDHPYYLVTLLPLETEQGMSIGGTGLTNSFATFVSSNANLDQLGWLIAHEYFHNWNYLSFGGLEDPEQLLYWFSEGFTDFYTYRLLLRGGLLEFEQMLDEYNEFSKDYYTSPVRNIDNQRVLKDFFRDHDVGKIPYRRGFLLATKWDHIIRKQSGGKKSLDDVMRQILADARAGKFKKLSKDLIGEYLSNMAEYDFAGDIEKFIEKGETIEFFKDELGNCVETSEIKIGRFDLGFDFTSSREKLEITGVSENSAAFQNGLRNGQKLKGVSIHYGNTELPAKLQVSDNGAEKTISYLPVSEEKVAVPQYRRKAGLSETVLKQCLNEFGVK